eukprot:m.3891 g.3891  ORF g.3891 m.3891 type:complete len:378 (-) comp2358_c0_seq2:120-1253(-)
MCSILQPWTPSCTTGVQTPQHPCSHCAPSSLVLAWDACLGMSCVYSRIQCAPSHGGSASVSCLTRCGSNRFCLDAADSQGIPISVTCLEANALAYDFCKNAFASEARIDVRLFALHPSHSKDDLPTGIDPNSFDLCISELLGCFADNEFMPELLDAAARLLMAPDGVFIPRSLATHIAPFSSPSIRAHFAEKALPADATYILGMPSDAVLLATPALLYSMNSGRLGNNGVEVMSASTSWKLDKAALEEEAATPLKHAVDGVVGFFTSELYPGLSIDTRPGPTQNCFHWEAFYFPFREPVMPRRSSMLFSLNRCCQPEKDAALASTLYLWYEWQVTEHPGRASTASDTEWQNANGASDCVSLTRFSNVHDDPFTSARA